MSLRSGYGRSDGKKSRTQHTPSSRPHVVRGFAARQWTNIKLVRSVSVGFEIWMRAQVSSLNAVCAWRRGETVRTDEAKGSLAGEPDDP